MRVRVCILLLFSISGFSGLIYEAIWSHYLKLFLGHAAIAQTLVLIIFMGGMAIGSWLAGRSSLRITNLLLAYAVVEGIVGAGGLAFHAVFVHSVEFIYRDLLPALGSPMLASLCKWLLGAALILPQSILLGMTFPLLSGALIRRFPDRAGNTLALLCFVNSLGGAVGVIVSGFVLMDRFGLPGTILTAGLINIAVALLIWSLARQPAWRQPGAAPDKQRESTTWPAPQVTLLVAAGITGAASFIYEIAWLRMLNLVLGATTHSFELMLSAFILGLVCGSLWIRRYIQVLTDPVRFLGIVQIFMGCFALATLWLYAETFYWMAGLLELVSRTSAGYLAFNLGSHAIAFAVMLPATFCAGTTLPLITYALLNSGYGERSVGQVYAVNTLGAIIGVVLAVQVGLTLIGLKGVVLAGAALDIGLGLVLLRRRAEATVNARVLVPGVIGLGFLGMTWAAVQLNPLQMASTVYLFGNPDILRDAEVPFHQDGKSATVNLIRYPSGILGITTNGKTDAAIQMREGKPANLDEFTMTLLGALPLAVHPGAKAIAVIGFGSGLTTHTLLASPDVERVDTIDIEPAVVLAAEQFRPRVERAFADPRSHVYIDDAKSFFSSQQNDYDIIVSEPSNPWVSGIASLYTREFYRFVRGHLRDQGIFAQWLHVYDLDMPLFGSVLNAMAESFPDYAVYNLNDQDALIIAGGSLVERNAQLAQTLPDAVLPELARLGMQRGDLPRLRIGSRSLLQPLLDSYAVTANSDYFPVLDLNAVRTRFLQKDARDLFRLQNSPLPLLEMLSAEDVRPAARYTTHRSATAFLANLVRHRQSSDT